LKILDSTAISGSVLVRILRFSGENCRKTVQNPEISSGLSQNARGLVRGAIQPLRRLAFHLQLHLRVLLEWNGRSDWTLAAYYAAGRSFCVRPEWMNDFGLGNNG
jgi:hypothetical protein